MRTFDLTPFNRFTVGFDSMGNLLESLSHLDDASASYPPYNIEKLNEDNYRISMAVAGFSEDEIDLTVKENTLYISGRKNEKPEETEFLYKGIATRAFERSFELANHIKVTNASLNNGILTIELVREIPEEMKPRKIHLTSCSGSKSIEHKDKEGKAA